MAERPFARVYYVDLERDYPDVYRDDHLYATYGRLLAVAEAMWPAVPEIPRSARAGSVNRLVAIGLVIRVAPYGFRVKGMDAERNARSNAASNAARIRWADAASNAASNANGHAPTMPSQPSQAKPTKPAKPVPAASIPDDEDPLDVYWRLTASYPSGRAKEWLTQMGNEFGGRATGNALAAEYSTGDRGTILKRTQNRLRAEAEKASKASVAKAEERETTRRAAMDITQEEADRRAAEAKRLMAEWTAEMPPVVGPFQPIGSKP